MLHNRQALGRDIHEHFSHTKFFTSIVRKVNIVTRRHNLRISYQKTQTQRALLGFSGAPRQNP